MLQLLAHTWLHTTLLSAGKIADMISNIGKKINLAQKEFLFQASPVMGLAVSALSSPRSAPPLHEASADCMIALLTRIEREECSELEGKRTKRFTHHDDVIGEHSGNSVHNGG